MERTGGPVGAVGAVAVGSACEATRHIHGGIAHKVNGMVNSTHGKVFALQRTLFVLVLCCAVAWGAIACYQYRVHVHIHNKEEW